MTTIDFETKVSWSGTGKQGEGEITMNDVIVGYSAPATMGGKGTGVSPEDLLIGAVTTCYSGTFFSVLTKKGLPVKNVTIRATGKVTGYPFQSKFSELTVHPTIVGGASSKLMDYEQAAIMARDKCFIGKSIAGNIDYKVGTVEIANE